MPMRLTCSTAMVHCMITSRAAARPGLSIVIAACTALNATHWVVADGVEVLHQSFTPKGFVDECAA